jgi:MHS family proline/betaine transporter-like MFS transporter
MSPAIAYFATMVLAALGIVLCPVAGHLADRVGLTRMVLPAAILMLLTFYPVFRLIVTHPGLTTLLVGLIWETLLQIAYMSALPAVMAGIFPARTRVTGLSLSYNLGVTVFGGFAPAIFTWLTAITHDNAAPGFYLTATAVISIVAIVMVNRRHPHMLVRAPRVG